MSLLQPLAVPTGSTLLGISTAYADQALEKRFNTALALAAGSVLAQNSVSISNPAVPGFDSKIVALATDLANNQDIRNAQAKRSIIGALVTGAIVAGDDFNSTTVPDALILGVVEAQLDNASLLVQLL